MSEDAKKIREENTQVSQERPEACKDPSRREDGKPCEGDAVERGRRYLDKSIYESPFFVTFEPDPQSQDGEGLILQLRFSPYVKEKITSVNIESDESLPHPLELMPCPKEAH